MEGLDLNDNYLSVLEQYEGDLSEVRKGRGAWICQWAEGIRLLREYRGSVKRLEFEESILEELKERGIRLVDQYVRNRDNGNPVWRRCTRKAGQQRLPE